MAAEDEDLSARMKELRALEDDLRERNEEMDRHFKAALKVVGDAVTLQAGIDALNDLREKVDEKFEKLGDVDKQVAVLEVKQEKNDASLTRMIQAIYGATGTIICIAIGIQLFGSH